VMEAIASCRASAVSLDGTGLTDVHVASLAKVILDNKFLLHVSASIACTELTGMEVLQGLVQNSPMLVSGFFTPGEALLMKFANPIQIQKTGDKQEGRCCGLKYEEYSASQTMSEHQFPAVLQPPEVFETYNESLASEIHEHSLVPMRTVLGQLWEENPRKIKNLERAAGHDRYSTILSEDTDQKKFDLMRKFFTQVNQAGSPEDMFKFQGELSGQTIGNVAKALDDSGPIRPALMVNANASKALEDA